MNVPDISILDTIDDLQEKLAVKAFITTTLSAPQIEEKLHIGIKKIYRIAEKYFPRGFVKDRQLEINNGKFIVKALLLLLFKSKISNHQNKDESLLK